MELALMITNGLLAVLVTAVYMILFTLKDILHELEMYHDWDVEEWDKLHGGGLHLPGSLPER